MSRGQGIELRKVASKGSGASRPTRGVRGPKLLPFTSSCWPLNLVVYQFYLGKLGTVRMEGTTNSGGVFIRNSTVR